jgi:hypothetical protein
MIENFKNLFNLLPTIIVGIIAFFLSEMHHDFKEMRKDVNSLQTETMLIKQEIKFINKR